MENQAAAVVFGLTSALVWGAGDFFGGLGSRRASILPVLLLAEICGLAVLVAAAFVWREPFPTLPVIFYATGAGLAGTLGLGALYRGLVLGRASVVAPVSAVVGAGLPGLYTALTIGLPDQLKLIGFALALVSIVLASQSSHGGSSSKAFFMGLLAGVGFGSYFILAHLSGVETTFGPLAIARGVSIPLLLVITLARHAPMPSRAVLPIIILSGILDAGGNVFFLLAAQLGRLDIATILAGLYPASTVILSRVFIGERTNRLQQIGFFAALAAIALIAY